MKYVKFVDIYIIILGVLIQRFCSAAVTAAIPKYTDILPNHLEFGYTQNRNGPLTWSSRYNTCAGKRQSPINVNSADFVVATLPPLRFEGLWDERKDGLVLQNTWNAVEVRYTGDAPKLRGGPLRGDYLLSTIHFHWGSQAGSEHSLEQFFYGMEAQLIYYKRSYGSVVDASKENDGLVIVALFLSAQQRNSQGLVSIISGLRSVRAGGTSTTLPDDAMMWSRKNLGSNEYYTYQGSMTTPPCSEIVTWIVIDSVATIGINQIREFQKLNGPYNLEITENRRPTQPLNGRQVLYASGHARRKCSEIYTHWTYFMIILFLKIL